MNRRRFLSASAASLAPAQQKIRFALYGTRHSHARGKLNALLNLPHYELAGICEPQQPALPASFAAYPKLSEEQLFHDATIQLVVVETPVWEAMDYARKVIAAGKHLHLEKPPTNEWKPFQELIQQARQKRLLVQLGYIWRFHEGIRRAIELAKGGMLGKVYLMRGAIHTDLSEEARAPLARYKGGMMFELGCHLLDRAVDLFGRPKVVKSWLQKGTNGKGDLADHALAVLEYDSALAVITTSARMSGSSEHRSFEVIGSDGCVLIQPVEPGTNMRVNLRTARGSYQAGWQNISLPPQQRYIGDFQDLARAIQTSSPLRYSYDFELLLQETILRASQEL
ncbi:MAG: Gfo/Idh/MocA family oxidoreductase [Bryobacteraceae bacterium]|nr:Gfo/Idh/MocA family oxidoreductase [Bryobacteraceae bacterium]MDW8379139.1 Gfo/Idh/MocA family oxidoreductase [Bryobacterales bacterium]